MIESQKMQHSSPYDYSWNSQFESYLGGRVKTEESFEIFKNILSVINNRQDQYGNKNDNYLKEEIEEMIPRISIPNCSFFLKNQKERCDYINNLFDKILNGNAKTIEKEGWRWVTKSSTYFFPGNEGIEILPADEEVNKFLAKHFENINLSNNYLDLINGTSKLRESLRQS